MNDPSGLQDEPLPRLNHRQIEAFRAVMISGTATGAAVLLHTTQPVISKLINRLQTATGVKLFELHKTRLVPTSEAQVLFRSVERSYVGLDEIGQTVASLRHFNNSRIAIGTLPSFGLGLLPQIVGQFLKEHPTTQVSLETVNSSLIKFSVASGKADIGITLSGIDAAGVGVSPLVSMDAVCVMGPAHPLTHKRVIKVQDLQGENFIAPTQDSASAARQQAVFFSHSVTPHVVAETSYAFNICMLALQGAGVGIVSPLVVPYFTHSGLVVRPFAPSILIDLLLLQPLAHTAPGITGVFIQHMRKEIDRFKAETPWLQR